jgi:hypothetical protein
MYFMKNPFKRTFDANPYGYRGAPSPSSRSIAGSNKLKILEGAVIIIIIIFVSQSVVVVQA